MYLLVEYGTERAECLFTKDTRIIESTTAIQPVNRGHIFVTQGEVYYADIFWRRSGLLVLGMTAPPPCTPHLSKICAVVRSYLPASSAITG